MQQSTVADVDSITQIDAVPKILEAVSELTGLKFVCIARVTESVLRICAVLDKLNYGFKVGDSLDVTTTLCDKVREKQAPIIIDSVQDSEYRDHHAPKTYGFQSYFSIPLYRPSGEYFGTLCGLDPQPAQLSTPAISKTLSLFAELISRQLASDVVLVRTRDALEDAIETSKLRERFIAVLGHDLRTPLHTILNGIEILGQYVQPAATPLLETMRRSGERITALINDVSDFTRGRMCGGISLDLRHETNLERVLNQAIDELRNVYPGRTIVAEGPAGIALLCDAQRMAQMLSNLLKNALVHGSATEPVYVKASQANGVFTLMVTNAGPAIPIEIQTQLFKPFWQAAKSGPNQGLGLGLYIASEIASSHGGTLTVDSCAARTTFTYQVHNAALIERREFA